MYKYLIRPLMFLFSAETAHGIVAKFLKVVNFIPGGKSVMRAFFSYRHPSLEREVWGLKFRNPIGIAAGFDKNGDMIKPLSSLGFGFIEVGTVTPRAQTGNPKPRSFRLPQDKALINRMGFNNKGLENLLDNLRGKKFRTVVGGNIGKNTLTANEDAPADYLTLFRNLYQYVDYFVVNVSCPNVENIGSLQQKDKLMGILTKLFEFRQGQDIFRPIMLKISPDLNWEQVDDIVDILIDTPLDGIVANNTTTSRQGLTTNSETVDDIGKGGLSGSPLTQRTIEMVRYIHQKSEGRYPIIGVGGIMSVEDAQEMLDAGASLIQVYTGFIYNGPGFVRKICKHLKNISHERSFVKHD